MKENPKYLQNKEVWQCSCGRFMVQYEIKKYIDDKLNRQHNYHRKKLRNIIEELTIFRTQFANHQRAQAIDRLSEVIEEIEDML